MVCGDDAKKAQTGDTLSETVSELPVSVRRSPFYQYDSAQISSKGTPEPYASSWDAKGTTSAGLWHAALNPVHSRIYLR